MITCPNCQHQELTGALFCSECGAQLTFTEKLSTQSIQKLEEDRRTQEAPAEAHEQSSQVSNLESKVSINLVDNGKILPLRGRSEFTLGRITEGQPILPDIDLSPFEAYSQGVSRLHAALKISSRNVTVMDLGSSNGTRVNGQKIIPNVDYPIHDGDIIALGRLRIQMLIHYNQ